MTKSYLCYVSKNVLFLDCHCESLVPSVGKSRGVVRKISILRTVVVGPSPVCKGYFYLLGPRRCRVGLHNSTKIKKCMRYGDHGEVEVGV